MKQLYLAACIFLLAPGFLRAQAVSINTDASAPAPSAILDVKSTNKGMLVPRMSTAQRTAIAAPATGLLVFDTNTNGFWFYNGAAWTNLASGSAPTTYIADTDGNTKVQTEKTPNEDVIHFDLGGMESLVLRRNAGGSPRLELPNGLSNTFIGNGAGSSNTTGQNNTALGFEAGKSTTSGSSNTFLGNVAGKDNQSGKENIFVGNNAGKANTTGDGNVFVGHNAGSFNTTGQRNICIGDGAGYLVAAGSNNNVFIGRTAGYGETGSNKLYIENEFLTTSPPLIYGEFDNNVVGINGKLGAGMMTPVNTLDVEGGVAIGSTYSGTNTAPANGAIIEGNVGIGTGTPAAKLEVSNGTIGLGVFPGLLDNVANNDWVTLDVNGFGKNVRIWDNFSVSDNAGIGRIAITNRLEVEGNASKTAPGSWLGNSDARLKKNITPLNSSDMLQRLLALQGVTYEWNDDKTGSHRPAGLQYGFTAQNIRQVFPTLVEEDKLGYLQTAYGTYDAMTVEAIRALNDKIEVLQHENESLHARVAELESVKADNAAMKAQLDKITAALQTAGIGIQEK